MIDTKRSARWILTLFCAASTVTLIACEGDGLPPRYKVTGTVTFKGAPLEKGQINFMPVDASARGASGVIKDGSFSLTTQTDNDGAFPGEYNVIVTDLNIDQAMIDEETNKAAAKSKTKASQPDQAAVAKATKSAKNTVPARYGSIRESGLKAKVEEKSNSFKFDLVE